MDKVRVMMRFSVMFMISNRSRDSDMCRGSVVSRVNVRMHVMFKSRVWVIIIIMVRVMVRVR